ncbi:MAG: DUF4224 domain-containing protein [Gammaproteobacteria bacterium]
MNAPVLEASKGFLSPEDLTRLTGYEAGQRQRIEGWLRRHGYVYEKNARGEVLVLWEHVREKLCQAHEEERVRPNFEAAFAPKRAYHEKRNRARLERERAPSPSSGRSLPGSKPAT